MKIVPIVSTAALAGAVILSAFLLNPTASKESSVVDSHPVSSSASPTATPTATATAAAAKPSDDSPISNGTNADPVSVNSPSNVDISEITNDSFRASWEAPKNTVGKITQYSILVNENGVAKDTYYTADTAYVVHGLSSNNAYNIEVRAFAVSDSGLKQATSNRTTSRTVVVHSIAPVEPPPVSENTPAPVQTSEAAVDQASVYKVVADVAGYYKFVGSAESLDKVKHAKDKYDGRSNLTDAELAELVAGFPEGFKYFDTSTSQNINNAYNQLFARATQSDRKPGATVVVPPAAVTIQGDTAKVNSTLVKVTLNGETYSATETPYFELGEIHLVKSKDGSWVIVAEAPRQSIP